MALIEINRNPSRKELNWFGGLFLLFFLLVGGIIWWRFGGRNVALVMWVLAAAITVLYYAAPPMRRPIYFGWLYLAFPIGWVISHVLMAVIFYLVFTPIGLIMRLLGRDPMTRKFDSKAKTYWVPHKTPQDSARYFRQF